MAEQSSKHNILVLIATSIGTIMNPLLASMIILAMPVIGGDFLVSARDLGWLTTAFLLANAICLVPATWFVDRIGYKKSYLIGSLIVCLGCFFSIFAWNYPVLLSFRIISGVGVSLLMVTALAILSRVFPKEKRGFIIGINTTMVYVGLTLGPLLGGLLTDAFGWQSIFVLMTPMVLISGILLFLFQKNEFTEPTFKFDLIGTIIYAAATFLLMYGLSTITDIGSPVLAAAGFALLILFIWYEKRKEHPVLHIGLFFKNKRFARSSFAALLNYAGAYGVVYMVSLYLQSVGEMSATEAGMIILFQPLVQVIVTPIAGKLSDKTDPKYLVTLGMVLTVIGLLCLSCLGFFATAVFWLITVSQILIGFGAALFSAPNTATIMNSVSKKEYSTASGIVSVVRQYGMLISTAVCMACISIIVGGTELLEPSVYGNFTSALQVAMLICAVLCIIGAFFSWFRGPVPEAEKE
ncbi:MAG TPA: MFS transporter [Methanocorpusculum sp.]|nr:MFS transporter [Methanocorpusculum sp.]HJJ40153.1 MFS transporter [Methanocorpusculum sp.]HJJ49064.1 MFS transporter [Methanocorpusculum sp.]HJJ57308.1 MFS transporter [Methanocorpusculum sp.]